MKIYVWGRQTGKTTKALELFIKTPKCAFFTIDNRAATRCKEILKRWGQDEKVYLVMSHRSDNAQIKLSDVDNTILDEADLFEHRWLYQVESLYNITAVFTSPAYVSQIGWLQRKICDYKNEYHRMPSTANELIPPEQLDKVRKSIGFDKYQKEYLAKPFYMDPVEWNNFWRILIQALPHPIDREWFEMMLYQFKKHGSLLMKVAHN